MTRCWLLCLCSRLSLNLTCSIPVERNLRHTTLCDLRVERDLLLLLDHLDVGELDAHIIGALSYCASTRDLQARLCTLGLLVVCYRVCVACFAACADFDAGCSSVILRSCGRSLLLGKSCGDLLLTFLPRLLCWRCLWGRSLSYHLHLLGVMQGLLLGWSEHATQLSTQLINWDTLILEKSDDRVSRARLVSLLSLACR